MSEMNPYQQPTSDVAVPPQAAELVIGTAQKVSMGDAMSWFGQGKAMLAGNWGVMIGALVVLMLLNVAVQFVPFIGGLAAMFLMTLLYAGLVKMFYRLDNEGSVEFADLFAGFSEKTGPLVILALLQLAVYVGIFIVAMVLLFLSIGFDVSMLNAMEAGRVPDVGIGGGAIALAGLIMFLFLMASGCLFYFSIPLVFLGNMGPGEALGLSFKACLTNLLPLILYGIVATVLVMVATIPLFLGLLLAGPLLAGAYYASFKQVFTE
ncbi:hypothetical protein Q670_12340 [Alcanivorax sp. P2S70]|uniref:BPSS1780 family membrane protein n=1 Tax=Alcanivorax TaxID=59753 RepID=UPI0003B498A1|nr:BPSS1780 family membrane protein [Alcanivorax sp. P2S70]ERP91250.1 hypothetical protein Q670_12340 [Alcanivorax sp. P2S70]